MKIETMCVDRLGVEAVIDVDLDYVHDADELQAWIENELCTWSVKTGKSFDILDFVVASWDDILKEAEGVEGA